MYFGGSDALFAGAEEENWPEPDDESTYSNIKEFVTKSFNLDIALDFDKKTISGT